MISNIKLFALSASKKLGEEIAQKLNIPLSNILISKFSDGEILVKPQDSIRNKEVYIIQSTNSPVNDNLLELLICIDSFKRGSAKKINIVIPYFGYARQDRKSKGREPITSKLVANLITVAGADRLITMDLHSPQSMGFFDIPVDDLKPIDEISEWIFNYMKSKPTNSKLCIVSPDHGGLERVRKIANKLAILDTDIAIIDKRRLKPNESKIQYILGDVADKYCFIIDDMIDTAGTISNAAKEIKAKGAKEVVILATHAVLSGNATIKLNDLLEKKIIQKLVLSNTINLNKQNSNCAVEIFSVAPFIADAIRTSVNDKSISELYIKRSIKLLNTIQKFVSNNNTSKSIPLKKKK